VDFVEKLLPATIEPSNVIYVTLGFTSDATEQQTMIMKNLKMMPAHGAVGNA